MVTIEIDGKKLEVEPGSMLIEAADNAGFKIPRFCYHKKLSVAANCRMCLVHVEKAPKPLPACATPVNDGMVVHTASPEAIAAQKSVMEFLLINHPLDCPICDQGGECELQDVAMGYGSDVSQFNEGKRAVADKDIGSLIATEMTRCIHCTRCVRFGEEVAGIRELGATGRGEHTEIGTYIQHHLVSEMSGNVIDLCPVGALTAKPSRFTARAWEVEQFPSIAAHDCVGSNIYLHALRNRVMRTVPKENEAINETWISDRDRFSYEAINAENRLHVPMIKQNGQWQETDWKTALTYVAKVLQKVTGDFTGSQVGAVISPNATTEEHYLLQKVMRGIGSQNIDHRLRQLDFSDQAQAHLVPHLGTSLEALEKQNSILLIGANVQQEQPIIGHRIRKASLKGTKVMSINPLDYAFNFEQAHKHIVAPSQMVPAVAGVAKALIDVTNHEVPADIVALLGEITASEVETAIAKQLQADDNVAILLGELALNHLNAAQLKGLSELIASISGATVGYLSYGANAAGACLAGATPHRGPASANVSKMGLDARHMFENKLKAYLLFGIEPELDCADPSAAMTALQQAEMNIVFTTHVSDTMRDYAHVMLPIASFAETSGSYVNIEGKWQATEGAVTPVGEARPGWKVLRVLGNLLSLDGFEYVSTAQIREELKQRVESMSVPQHKSLLPKHLATAVEGIERISAWPIYRSDIMVRNAAALQASATNEIAAIRLNAGLAQALSVMENQRMSLNVADQGCELPVVIDERVPDNCMYIAAGFAETMNLGAQVGAIEFKATTNPSTAGEIERS